MFVYKDHTLFLLVSVKSLASKTLTKILASQIFDKAKPRLTQTQMCILLTTSSDRLWRTHTRATRHWVVRTASPDAHNGTIVSIKMYHAVPTKHEINVA